MSRKVAITQERLFTVLRRSGKRMTLKTVLSWLGHANPAQAELMLAHQAMEALQLRREIEIIDQCEPGAPIEYQVAEIYRG